MKSHLKNGMMGSFSPSPGNMGDFLITGKSYGMVVVEDSNLVSWREEAH